MFCFVLMCVFLTRESRPKFVMMSDEHIFLHFEGGEATSTTRIGRDKTLHNNKKKKKKEVVLRRIPRIHHLHRAHEIVVRTTLCAS